MKMLNATIFSFTTINLVKKDLVYFTTQVPDTSNTSDTSVTRVQHEQHECNKTEIRATQVQHKCNTSATRTTRVRHERYTNNSSVTWVRNIDFDNDTSENIFSHPYISYMANERLQGEEQFHSKNYLLEMRRSRAKIHLKKAPQKLNFVMAKAISKGYTLDCSCKCSCTFPHSYT